MMLEQMPKSRLLSPKQLDFAFSLKAEISTQALFETNNKENPNQDVLNFIVHVSVSENYIIFTHDGNERSWGYTLNDEMMVDVQPRPSPTLDCQESQNASIDRLKFLLYGCKEHFQLYKINKGSLKQLYFTLCKKPIYFWDPKLDYNIKRRWHGGPPSPYSKYVVHGAITCEPYDWKVINKRQLVEKNKILFDREVQTYRRAKHPNILRLERLFQSQNTIYMVLQFSKYNLRQYVELYKFPTYEGKKYILRILLEAVSCLHSKDIVHGNIDFLNVFLVPQQGILIGKIGNFGVGEQQGSKVSDLKQIGQIFLELLLEKFIQADPSDIDLEAFPQKSALWCPHQIKLAYQMLTLLYNPPNQETKLLLQHPYISNTPSTPQDCYQLVQN